MTHLHIPDGILPIWLWVSGFVAVSIVLAIIVAFFHSIDMRKQIPLLGAISAVMLIAMSIPELPLIGYHINLSVAAGILLGPALGFVASFIANLILAFTGHGGITVIGLNTILLGSEAVLGHALFSLFRKRVPVFWSAAVSTTLTLFTTTLLLIGIVAIANVNPAAFEHEHEHAAGISVSTFAAIVISFGSIGWIIESAVTGAVIRFISRVKPDLLGHVLHTDTSAQQKAGPHD